MYNLLETEIDFVYSVDKLLVLYWQAVAIKVFNVFKFTSRKFKQKWFESSYVHLLTSVLLFFNMFLVRTRSSIEFIFFKVFEKNIKKYIYLKKKSKIFLKTIK